MAEGASTRKRLAAKFAHDAVFKTLSVQSILRWIGERLPKRWGYFRIVCRRIFLTNDGEYVLRILAKNNFVYDTNDLSPFDQGRRAAILELVKYVYKTPGELLHKIQEMEKANEQDQTV